MAVNPLIFLCREVQCTAMLSLPQLVIITTLGVFILAGFIVVFVGLSRITKRLKAVEKTHNNGENKFIKYLELLDKKLAQRDKRISDLLKKGAKVK